jgi:uncharacterized membrane protein YGL010W
MQQTNWQKTLEVVVKGFVAAIVALAGLWVLGWVFTFVGSILIGLAGIVVALLKFLVPVAVIAAIVYFFVSQIRPNPTTTFEARVEPKQIDLSETRTVETTLSTTEKTKAEVGNNTTASAKVPNDVPNEEATKE